MKDFPRVTYADSSNHSENIDEVLDRLESHGMIDPKYKQDSKELLLQNNNCKLILEYLCQLDDLRSEMGSQARMRRKGIKNALIELDSPILYLGD